MTESSPIHNTKHSAKICIISPGQLGSNPRVVKEATTLASAGHDVTVIATKVSDFVEARDQVIMAQANFKIVRVPFDNKWGWRTERMFQIVAQSPVSGLPNMELSDFAWSAFTRRLYQATKRVPADLFIAHYVAALPAAARAARKYTSRYAFDAEDYHLGDLPDSSEYEPERNRIEKIERRYLPSAAYVTAASPGIADAYAKKYDLKTPGVVLNTFPKSSANRSVEKMPRATKAAYWFSQTIGPNRGLECALKAASIARCRPHIHLRGTPTKGYDTGLRILAKSLGIQDQLHFHPPDSPDNMVPLAAQHDVGLVLETGHTHNRKIALTNKQFTYMLAGIPSILSDVPAHRAFAEQSKGACYLFRAEDADDLASKFDEILDDTDALASACTRAFELGQTVFNWETQEPILLEIVAEALA